MRMELTLHADRKVSIPVNYNYQLSSLIYSNITGEHSQVHEIGFPLEKRTFRLFTFSRLMFLDGYGIDGRNFLVKGRVSFVFSSPIEKLAQEFGNTIMRTGTARLGGGDFSIESVRVIPPPKLSQEVFVRTLSPITMQSTLLSANGKKKTYYYSPFEKEFTALLMANAQKKLVAFNGKGKLDGTLTVASIGKQTEVVVDYKGIIVKGWLGIYKLSGDRDLIAITYEAGLGNKNSEGFGCFDVIRRDAARSPK